MGIAKKKQAPLRAALDNHLGRNCALQKQRKLEKAADKRKAERKSLAKASAPEAEVDGENADGSGWEDESGDEAVIEGDEDEDADAGETEPNVELSSGSESDEEDEEGAGRETLLEGLKKLAGQARSVNPEAGVSKPSKQRHASTDGKVPTLKGNTNAAAAIAALTAEDDVDEEEEEEDEEEDEEDIPLSDLSSIVSDQDILPYQRLTINNTAALTRALASIALPLSTLPFSAHQSVTASEPTPIPDVNDDLNRELSLYAQSLSAVCTARTLLHAEDKAYPFTRPTDYFAEMVKTDEHMTRVKQKLVDEAASKKASADARRQRDAKKFGKAVQQERLKERAKAKRDMLEKVGSLKRKRQEGGASGGQGEEQLFDVAVEEAAVTEKREKVERRQAGKSAARGGRGGARGGKDGEPNSKRQKKDEKFGFGGKKRFSKSGDAESAGDMRGFSTKRMKGQDRGGGGRGGARGGGSDRGRGGSRSVTRGGGRGGGSGGRGGSKRLGKSRRTAA